MARILISLLILLVLPPKIVLAESEKFDPRKVCEYIDAESSPEADSSIPGVTGDQAIVDSEADDGELEGALDSNQEEVSTQLPADENELSEEANVALAGISIPSLWWAREQFDPFGGKLISNWLTKPQSKQIDLVVNWQFWTLLDYLGRYRFINQFGTVARKHGYDLRIFNQQKQCLALYEYNQVTNPPKWEIKIEGFGQESLQVLPDIN